MFSINSSIRVVNVHRSGLVDPRRALDYNGHATESLLEMGQQDVLSKGVET